MFLPRDVARYLENWGYYPGHREDFGQNFLSIRLGKSRDRGNLESDGATLLAALCAVPRGRPQERVEDLRTLSDWLRPDQRIYEPKGIWIPFPNPLSYTSQGILFFEEDYRGQSTPTPWERYMLVGRDGYVEYARKAGFPLDGKPYYLFAPLVAWIQRFVALMMDLRAQLTGQPEYVIVLSMWPTEHAGLCAFGELWLEPWEARGSRSTHQCLERRVQISRPLILEDTPQQWGGWFAERVANAFGDAEARCFNHPDSKGARGAPGELPTNGLEFS
jgi:hypothetical protein